MKYIKKESGFTLIEVVASIVIITIVLLSFSQLFIQTNKTAVYNNERLVVINLAHAELERLKIDPFKKTGSSEGKLTKPISNTSGYIGTSPEPTKEIELNGRKYTIEINSKQSSNEKELQLINVTVTAISENGKTKNSVEGYVEYDIK